MANFCYNCFRQRGQYEVCMHCGHVEGVPNEPSYMLQPGMCVNDRYIIGTILGIGGFGVTYKAWDTRLAIIVAIKEFFPQTLASRTPNDKQLVLFTGDKKETFLAQQSRFMEEGRNLAKFASDPHVVNVLGTFSENDTSYIVMEYLDGVSLKEYLQQHGGRLSLEESSEIMDGVIKGLMSIHNQGILHRDISPDNIHVLPSGRIKILDFGAARLEEHDPWAENIVVKKGYAPPEQYRANMEQSYYTDIYAIGATWYKLITGITPEESIDRWEEDILVNPSSVLETERSEEMECIDYVIMKSLELRPEERFDSTQTLLDSIEKKERSAAVADGGKKGVYIPIFIALAVLIFIFNVLAITQLEGNPFESAVESMALDLEEITTEIVTETEDGTENQTEVATEIKTDTQAQGIETANIEAGEISFLIWKESNTSGIYDDLVEAFEEQYPEYSVELIQISDESEIEGMAQEELPTLTRILVDDYECADLTPVIESLDLEEYYILEQEMSNELLDDTGQIYFMPTGIKPYLWYANTKVADSWLMELPEVGDSLDIVWDTTDGHLNGASISMSGYMSLLQVYYPDSYDAESGSCELSLWEEDLKNYFRWIAYSTEYEINNSGSSVSSLSKAIAYGALTNSTITSVREDYDGYLELIPIVYEDKIQVELYRGVYVNENAEENAQLIAMQFIAFMLSEEGQEILNIDASSGSIPLLKASAEKYMNIYPEVQVFAPYLENEIGIYPTEIPTNLYNAWTDMLDTALYSDFDGAYGFANDAMELFYSVNE